MEKLPLAIYVGRKIGRAIARDVLAEDMPREWTGLDAQDADMATEAGLVPDGEEWAAMEREAEVEFRRMADEARSKLGPFGEYNN